MTTKQKPETRFENKKTYVKRKKNFVKVNNEELREKEIFFGCGNFSTKETLWVDFYLLDI
ncbi:CLUMA_CG020770, isoform A [Clunio marinus]|uniref:CLUMA_CG020770, isoform A n=1 Tax=Clunio marinus TaxID=568069 RepID=A0A1J1J5Z6_9DIPT|nr:CLUMA_CG020770, isoform A [Clunio marinus]